MPTERTDRA